MLAVQAHKAAADAAQRHDHAAREAYRTARAVYEDAIEVLKRKDGLPFGPLPLEIPERQKDVAKGDKTNVPTGDIQEGDLSFTAAQVVLSFMETVVQEEEKKMLLHQRI
jgi:hypothetical protein